MSAEDKSKRFFINHIDEYTTEIIGKFISNCVVGASANDGEEEDDEEREDDGLDVGKKKEGCYEVYGTTKDKTVKKPDFAKELFNFDTKEELYENLVECDVICYNICDDIEQIEEALWAITELGADADRIEKQKIFILLSSVMTWAKSKPLDPDDPEIPFTEDDYRRRKAHPNFKEHLNAEKVVLKLGKRHKSKIAAFVVASGICYGGGENAFHYLFKSAWHNALHLPIYGNGQNVVPTIHTKDLAGVIQNIADSKPKPKYIVAVDDSQNMLEEIVKAISSSLTTGKVKSITKEEALLNKDIDQSIFDQLLVSLRMEAGYIKESMKINWVSEAGIVESIDAIVKDYKLSRNLLPIRACILGPPASGKTTLVRQLCEHYKLHHIKIKDVIDETIANLERSAARADAGEDGEEDDDGKAAEDAEWLEAINENKSENDGRLDGSHITRMFKEKLMSMACRNQGFIIDGYPKTKEQADELFAPDDEEAEDEEDEKAVPYNKAIMPEFLFVLEATDDFLKQRIMLLPESIVSGTHNTEEGLLRRLGEYRNNNTDEETVVNFFDEREIIPMHFDVSKDKPMQSNCIIERIKKEIGPSRNYGPTPAEIALKKRHEEEEKFQREVEDRQERDRREAEETMDRKKQQEQWAKHLEQVKREEYELLEAQSLPLRNYLMKHVMPVLTEGLLECVKVRPEDPVDYLAEYIFRHNPQVD